MKLSASLSFRTMAIVGITLMALALGGSTELWAQTVVVLLAGIVMLLFPPKVGLGAVPVVVLTLFLAMALAAFLPASWGIMPEWRRHLTQDLPAALGDLRTPQPWLTLQACGLLLFGLTWAYYLFAQEWDPSEKSRALRLFAVGMVLLAAVSIVAYTTGLRIPGWNQEQNRGWFPNRNQTADVLALGGIVTYAIAFKRFQKGRRTGALWLAGLGLICVALVISYSRAGILMFFAGISFWHLGALFRPRGGKSLAIGLSSFVMLVSLFLLFGGTTLERFLKVPEPDNPYATDYRMLIQEDAVNVSLHSPLLGTGLGNFEPVFTSMRVASADQNRSIHPESDWLWMAVEMGWIAPLLLLAGLKWWVGQCLPFTPKSGEAVRRAAMVAVIMFLAHGFVDVSGHRLGSVCVALLLAALALSPAQPRPRQPWVAPLFRCLAVILCLMGGWWLGSITAEFGPPTTATLDRIQTRLTDAATEGRLASMSSAANAALEIAPLDWTFYFRRASAEAFRTGATQKAVADFQIARFLEPNWIELCINEGEVWLAADEADSCLDAWREALRRAGVRAIPVYTAMLRMSQDNPAVHLGLEKLADTNLDYLIAFLNYATPDEEKSAIDDLLARDPDLHTLDQAQQKKLFAAWYAHGDQADLAEQLLAHENWQASGWTFLARHFADQRDFELACLTALRHLPTPLVRQIPSDMPLDEMKIRYDSHSDDLAEGIMLCEAQIQDNRIDDALTTIAALEKIKDCPSYIFYLKATLCVKKQEWEEAWNALLQFGGI